MSNPFPITTTPASSVAFPPLPEHYRALLLSSGGPLFSALLSLSSALTPGTPLGGVGWLTIAVAVLTSLGVYFPASAWAKFISAIVGAVAQAVLSAAQGGFTSAEILTVVIMILSAMGIGALPNAVLPAPKRPRVDDLLDLDDAPVHTDEPS